MSQHWQESLYQTQLTSLDVTRSSGQDDISFLTIYAEIMAQNASYIPQDNISLNIIVSGIAAEGKEINIYSGNSITQCEILSCITNISDICTKPIPLCSSSCPHETNEISSLYNIYY